jgi:hypothetical protein
VELEISPAGMKLRDDPTQIGSQISIGKAARVWTMMWLLVRSWGGQPTGRVMSLSSHPLHLKLEPGGRYSSGDLTFNPNFSDWLMGWPQGWTDPERPAMEWSAWLQRMRGELSRLSI